MLKKVCGMCGLIFILLAWGAFVNVPAARAQSSTPPVDEACRACHENLYLLHDTGKSFCLCAQKMTCTCCHGGNPQALNEEEAHQGMVLNPVHGDATPCQKCHPDDSDTRVEKFAAVAGIHSFHPVTPMPSPTAPAIIETPTAAMPLQWLDPWQWIGLGGLGFGMILLIIFGYRCWKADCFPQT